MTGIHPEREHALGLVTDAIASCLRADAARYGDSVVGAAEVSSRPAVSHPAVEPGRVSAATSAVEEFLRRDQLFAERRRSVEDLIGQLTGAAPVPSSPASTPVGSSAPVQVVGETTYEPGSAPAGHIETSPAAIPDDAVRRTPAWMIDLLVAGVALLAVLVILALIGTL